MRSRLELRLTVSKPTSAERMSLLLCTFILGSRDRASCIAARSDQALSCARTPQDRMPDIKSFTAAELLRLYRRRELSPVEVTRDQLDRIEKFQPILNAFIIVDRDGA